MVDYSKLPRPEPSAGSRAYAFEREAALAMDERRRDNYARYLASRGRADVDYLPVKLDIENVSRCNLRCTMCAVSLWEKGTRARDMTLAEFKALIDEQYGLVEIKLNGLGEALMQGNDYFEMIRYARSKRIWVRMTTNASLLHVRDNYRKLVDSGVNEIDISIDGADKATYEKIRVKGRFERVTDNCKRLNKYCASLGIVRTKMWTLVQRDNYKRLNEHVTLAALLGFKHLVFSMNLHGWADPALEKRNASVTVDTIIDPDVPAMLVLLGQSVGVRVSFWDVNDKFTRERPCAWPFERAVVTSDLRTVPCCMIADPSKFEIGAGKPFMENWRGNEYREFRQAHLDGNIPKVCQSCYKNQ